MCFCHFSEYTVFLKQDFQIVRLLVEKYFFGSKNFSIRFKYQPFPFDNNFFSERNNNVSPSFFYLNLQFN